MNWKMSIRYVLGWYYKIESTRRLHIAYHPDLILASITYATSDIVLSLLHTLILLWLSCLLAPVPILSLFSGLGFGSLLAALAFLVSLEFLFRNALSSIELVNHQLHDHVLFEKVERGSFVDSTLDVFLLLGSLDNPLLNGPLGDQLIDIDISALPDTMSSVGRLCVHRGVPVVVIENDCVRSRESDSQST